VLAASPDPADLARCVHCGLCLQDCPTYVVTGDEAESPRGRIHLIQALGEGRIEVTPAYREHLELCLVCRNCESVCPSGVRFGRIMEPARAQLYASTALPLGERAFRRLVFHELLPHPARLRLAGAALRAYQRSGLRRLVALLPARLRDAEQLLPRLGRPFVARHEVYPAHGPTRHRVGLFTGCVMPLVYGRVHEATIRVLTWNGCEVHVPRGQACCGALNVHGGERRVAGALARRNARAFLAHGVETVIVNSAGCGSTMKEYGELVDDPAARELAGRTRDVLEFLASIELRPARRPVRRVVTLQDSCHLVHAQRATTAARRVLAQVPGLELRELAHPDRCCGSAGLYMLTQPAMSRRLLEDTMAEVRATGATTIATANPGCMLQLEAGVRRAGLRAEVRHVVELLDESYRVGDGVDGPSG
jgi:glycolate oxidase iron-sulfur subunit